MLTGTRAFSSIPKDIYMVGIIMVKVSEVDVLLKYMSI